MRKLLCCLWIISLMNCKEEKDEIFPIVTMVAPPENSSYNVLDPIVVQANVSDNQMVESVRISLISDVTKNQVLSAKTIAVNQKDYFVNQVFEISDSLLETGKYYFRVEAFDGENYFSAFRFITINGINRKKLGVLVSCKNGSNTDIYTDQNDFSFQLMRSFTGNYQASVFNSTDQHFWFVPSNGDVLSAYSFNENTMVYNHRYLSSFASPFSDLKREGRDVLIALKSGEVDGRNQSFSDSFTYLAQSGRKVESLAANESYVLVEDLDNAGSNRRINVLRRNGSIRSSTVFNDDVVEIIFTDKDRCIVLANNAQGGRGVVLDLVTGNILNTLFTTDFIRSVVKDNSGNLVIATSSVVEYYTVQNGSLVNYLNKPNAMLAFDDLSNVIYVGWGSQLEIYSYPNQTGSIFQLPSEVVGVDLRYNKN